jgi:cysteine-rich repeat protein
MRKSYRLFSYGLLLLVPLTLSAQALDYATTTLSISICGNLLVDAGEDCDVPGETGTYSQTIVGRQCSAVCLWGPYCGDGILQTIHGEQCDDGNNDNGDFCSAICKIEPAGSGGGGSSGGGLGDTVLSVSGTSYPSRRVNFLIDSDSVGSAQADGSGRFTFETNVSDGTATLGIWVVDSASTRSITLNNTFDVTQAAVTNLNGIIVPPTIRVSSQNVSPGSFVTVSGQSVPNATVEVLVDQKGPTFTTTTGPSGAWTLQLDTRGLSAAEHIIKARSITGTSPLVTRSSYSSSLQLFLGVAGRASTPSDLNRDGSINLTDFSILIFWWGTAGGDSDPPADINGNGRVSLEDFSILLFNWTG